MGCCKNKKSHFQAFPTSSRLEENTNLLYHSLCRKLKNENGQVYSYIVKSVKNINGMLQQKGCGPNWQGGIVTLCTCKHFMRTFKDNDDWPGTWIAGFTSAKDGDGANTLVYLTRIEKSFLSHHDLWYSLPQEVRLAKASNKRNNIFGDVYRPKGRLKETEKHYPPKYYTPCSSHVHIDGWQNDVNYFKKNRYASLFVGDVSKSFLWDKPLLRIGIKLHRGQKKMLLSNLIGNHLFKV